MSRKLINKINVSQLNNMGDTIVEVLIVLAILGSGLITSYAIATKAVLIGRDAQDRNIANSILLSQIEDLRAGILNSNSAAYLDIINTVNKASFCLSITSSASPQIIYNSIASIPSTSDFSPPAGFSANCTSNNSLYFYYIEKITDNNAVNYVAHIFWPSVYQANVVNQSILAYRVYPPQG